MNREIKFRTWDSVHNKMIYLKDVALCGYDNEFDVYELYFEENNLKCRGYDDFDDDFGGTIVNETELPIMEYTGLKDKNGIEIYEGDVCKGNEFSDEDDLFIIKYGKYKTSDWKEKYISNTYQYGWYAEYVKTKDQVHLVTPNGIEVIGNIYENEEE